METLGVMTLKPQALTWEGAIRLFMLRCRSQNVAPSTQGLYSIHIGGMVKWMASHGAFQPTDVTADTIREYLDAYKARGVKATTVDCAFRIIRTFWTFCHKDGLIISDPMANVQRPKRERRFVKPITEEQLRLLLAQINTASALGLRDYALVLFLADTGLRISEALSIKIADVDWSANTVIVLGKGRKERRVAFGQSARKALMAWMQRRGAAEVTDHLWINRYGTPMKRVNFQQRMKRYTRRAGIAADRLSPHAFRHFFALQFLRGGGDAMSLQKLLGHSSLDMVRNYCNMTDDEALAKHRQASPLDRMGPLPRETKVVKLK